MSEKGTSVEVHTAGVSYLGWRAELMAELALARIPELGVHRKRDGSGHLPFSFLVVTPDGFCFFVEARAFSSFQMEIEDVDAVSELRWSVDADLIRRAHENRTPVLLFLFDADTDHGRYLRLDTFPAPAPDTHRLTLHLPITNTITRESLERVIANLREAAKS